MAEPAPPSAWFLLAEMGAQRGPYTGAQLAAMLEAGVLDDTALAWRSGLSGWTQLAHARAVLQEPSPELEPSSPRTRADGVARLSHKALAPPVEGGVPPTLSARHCPRPAPAAGLPPASRAEAEGKPPAPISVTAPPDESARRGSRLGALGATLGSAAASAALAPVRQLQRITGWGSDGASSDAGASAALSPGLLARLLLGRRSGAEPGAHGGARWEGLRGAMSAPASPRRPACVFGVRLHALASPARGGDGRVPRLFCALAAHLGRPLLLRTEGLFRVSPDVARVRALRFRLDAGEHEGAVLAELDGSGGEPHVAAALLKAFLRDLPEPLCTFELYDLFVDAGLRRPGGADGGGAEGASGAGGEELQTLAELRALVARLPTEHHELLLQTCALLAAVAEEHAHNRMPARSLAAIFAPNLLRPREHSLAQLTDLGATVNVTRLLIERRDDLFGASSALEQPPPPPPLVPPPPPPRPPPPPDLALGAEADLSPPPPTV